MLQDFVTAYVDDLIIASETFEEHVRHLEAVFIRLKENGLTANWKKTQFCRKMLTFLGHEISAQGIGPCKIKL